MKRVKVNTFIRFMKLLGKRWPVYIISILLMTIGSSAFAVISSLLLKQIFEIAQSGQIDRLPAIILANFLAGLISISIFGVFMALYNIEAKRGFANTQKMVLEKIMKLPMDYYENHHSGDIISKLLYDAQMASQMYTSRLRRVVAPIISVIVYLIPMFILCAQVTLCLIAVNILSLLVNSLLIKPMKKAGKEASKKNSFMVERLSNLIQGIEMIKIFDEHSSQVRSYKNANREYTSVQKKKAKLSALLNSMNTGFDLLSSLAFLAIGMIFVENGVTTIGSLAAIYAMYGAFSFRFLQIGRYFPELMNNIVYAERVFEFLDVTEDEDLFNKNLKSDITEDVKFDASKKECISIENLSFGYNSERNIFNNFSMKVEKGNCVALIGKSGRGKSTLAKLLLGFYPISEGNISFFGKSFSELGKNKVLDMIAYVPQEAYLFNVSIKENIRYGKLDSTDEEIYEAAKKANAHEFILNQADGYDTVVGERGKMLSGGERQRIAIARAIIKESPILLLDEATSALDNSSEELVQGALNRLMKNRTTIMIAHRTTTIAMADKIITI